MAKTNPLDAFASGTTANDFRFSDMPSLSEHMKKGFKEGAESFDAAMREWKQQAERQVIERLSAKTNATSPVTDSSK